MDQDKPPAYVVPFEAVADAYEIPVEGGGLRGAVVFRRAGPGEAPTLPPSRYGWLLIDAAALARQGPDSARGA